MFFQPFSYVNCGGVHKDGFYEIVKWKKLSFTMIFLILIKYIIMHNRIAYIIKNTFRIKNK